MSGRRIFGRASSWFCATAAWQENSRLELHRPKNLGLPPRSRHLLRIPWALALQRKINFHGASFLEGAEVFKNDFTTCFQIRNTVNKCATTLLRDRVTEAVLLPIFRLCYLDDLRIISCLENISSNLQGTSTSNRNWTFEPEMGWASSQN